MKNVLNDLCFLLLYTRLGNHVLNHVCDIAWMYGYIRGRVIRFYRRIAK